MTWKVEAVRLSASRQYVEIKIGNGINDHLEVRDPCDATVEDIKNLLDRFNKAEETAEQAVQGLEDYFQTGEKVMPHGRLPF